MEKCSKSITVILDDPAKPGMLVDESPSRKVSEDAAWSRWDGNDEPRRREQQPSKAERPRRKHPLTVQPLNPSVPAPLLHQGVLVGSSLGCPAPKLSPVPKRKSISMHPNTFGHLGDPAKATQHLLMEQTAQPSARTDPTTLTV